MNPTLYPLHHTSKTPHPKRETLTPKSFLLKPEHWTPTLEPLKHDLHTLNPQLYRPDPEPKTRKGQLFRRNVQRFRGELVFKAHMLLSVSRI